ncbi:type II toxin-antitoxin system RelE/ParE family toxin [Accumulibacter sp.]
MLPHGRYLIFCQPSEDVVRIARVLHGARDMGTAFLK